ncbi:MAG: SulP family inorganic anion transporter [Psychrilyobacter sp.]|nr:SulP family inorganic anion transporter [Psychrilyobacter sp.]
MLLSKEINYKTEILSGLTVAIALVPEAIAFSFVLGVDPLIGLYSAFIMGLVTSILGGRPGMISGATGAIAVVLVALVADHGVEYLFATIVLMGIFQILAGVLRLGKFSRMIPHPVMLGFVNGLAIVIFKAQLGQFKVIDSLGNSSWMTGSELFIMAGLIALTMGIIRFLPKLTKVVPSTLVAIVVTTLISLKLNSMGFGLRTVTDFAGRELSGGLPKFHLPMVPLNLETFKIILPYAMIASFVGLVESLLTLSLIDELTDTRGRSNKECIGQGIANICSGFTGGMGGCAMIGQSMINVSSGGKTRISSGFAALSLIIFIMFGSSLIGLIPLAALVGVMFMVVIGTFEWESLNLLNKIPKKDILVIIVVTIITVQVDLAVAVIAGIIISALIFAWEKGRSIGASVTSTEKGIKVYTLDGPLFFGSVALFKELFTPQEDPQEVYIDFINSKIMDHSAIEAINSITEKYKALDKKIHLRHLSADCILLLDNAQEVVEINVLEDPKYHVADDQLA